jgi:Ca2+-binding RTX toxin-like protein
LSASEPSRRKQTSDGFSGGGGDDEIHGGDGADDLAGDSGDDRVFDGAGNDIAEGTNGADIVDGGSGSDQIYGDIANCSVFCNFDADQLFARDGQRDVVDCGGGADTRSGRRARRGSGSAAWSTASRPRRSRPRGRNPARCQPARRRQVGQAQGAAQDRSVVPLQVRRRLKVTATLTYKGRKLGAGRKTLKKAGTAPSAKCCLSSKGAVPSQCRRG